MGCPCPQAHHCVPTGEWPCRRLVWAACPCKLFEWYCIYLLVRHETVTPSQWGNPFYLYSIIFWIYLFMRVDKLILPTSFWGMVLQCLPCWMSSIISVSRIIVVATTMGMYSSSVSLSFFFVEHPLSIEIQFDCLFDIHYIRTWTVWQSWGDR